jgi:hypothetical protein
MIVAPHADLRDPSVLQIDVSDDPFADQSFGMIKAVWVGHRRCKGVWEKNNTVFRTQISVH